jgi:hypothetical protein
LDSSGRVVEEVWAAAAQDSFGVDSIALAGLAVAGQPVENHTDPRRQRRVACDIEATATVEQITPGTVRAR